MESDFKLENVTIHYSDPDILFVTFSFSGGDDYNGLRFEFYCQDEKRHFTSTTRTDEATIVVAIQGLEHSETTVETMKLEMNMILVTPKTIMINQTFTAQVNVTSYGYPVQGTEVKWNALGGVIKLEEIETYENGTATAEIVKTYEQLNLKAQASKLGYGKLTVQKNIKITVQTERKELTISILGFNVNVFMLLIIGALIIAAGLGAYVYLKYRKSKQNGIEDLEIYT